MYFRRCGRDFQYFSFSEYQDLLYTFRFPGTSIRERLVLPSMLKMISVFLLESLPYHLDNITITLGADSGTQDVVSLKRKRSVWPGPANIPMPLPFSYFRY